MKMLIVDDSLVIRRKIERELRLPGIEEIISAKDGLDAIDTFREHQPDLVTMDLTMPHLEGAECVRQLVTLKPDTLILVISALADKATAIAAIKNGAHGFICKPFTAEDLNSALLKLMEYSRKEKKRA